ncbi:hypothetical protein TSUD_363380 [Trifolium subterraneum]|uniref:Nop domain-containing protein n=1 Tax=Trifolium subterraneum TaxID=3900 RepID=A0A2Z6NSZ6_TRISU|nr:hypothetical protein TSUD_363380 [Trifolium subterraneum]
MDLTFVDLEGLLPSAIIIVVSVTASNTTGKPLSEVVLNKTIEACDRALALDSAKRKSCVAVKLMVTAGGLSALAKTPACNVGHIEQMEIFQTIPPYLRIRACRLLAAKSTFAAQVDSVRGDPSGKTERSLKDEIHKKIAKWQEPPPA